MAVMWPRVLPEWVMQDPRRSAEREVYRQLQLVLNEDWTVYYSRPWWGITPRGGEIDGEADFVVVHPGLGVLFIEVKGGGIEYDSKSDTWFSTDRNGVRHRIKDPIQQAMSSKHRLLDKFKSAKGWPNHRVRLRHGVIFPHCESKTGGQIGPYERQLICCATEFRDSLAIWINTRLTSYVSEGRDIESGPGLVGVKAIDSAIAAPVRLSVPLHRQLQSEISQQDELLTGAQLSAVHSIEAFPRTVVEGGAGTGKTVIACELAIRYAQAGRAVLLCCMSEALARTLKQRVGFYDGLDVLTLAELERVAGREGGQKWSAVIVDEGQDVGWELWDCIEACLEPKSGVLRVLFDSNQAVYRARDDLETRLQATCFPLRLNLRNTQSIATVTEKLYRGPLIGCAGPFGQPVSILEVQPTASNDEVARIVVTLIKNEHVLPADIAVLAPDEKITKTLRSTLMTARTKVCNAMSRDPGCVVVDTIARFKGLEAAVVVLVVNRVAAASNELSYVGVSRARVLLFVVGSFAGTLLAKAMKGGLPTEAAE